MASITSAIGGTVATVTLEPSDNPRAVLNEPFQAHVMPALMGESRLLSAGRSSSWSQGAKLFTRLLIKYNLYIPGIDPWIHEAIKDKAVIDVDGSYTYLKHKKLSDSGVSIVPLEQPTCALLSGWQGITEANVREIAERCLVLALVSLCVVSLNFGICSYMLWSVYRNCAYLLG